MDTHELPEAAPCSHHVAEVVVGPPLDVCTACVETGAIWVHLRQCLVCGRTSCCNQSPNKHATAHYRATGHAMIRSAEPGEDWQWCYEDDRLYVLGPAGYESSEG